MKQDTLGPDQGRRLLRREFALRDIIYLVIEKRRTDATTQLLEASLANVSAISL
jgi:hypothetical protein